MRRAVAQHRALLRPRARRPQKKDLVKIVQVTLEEHAMHIGATGVLIAKDAGSTECIVKCDGASGVPMVVVDQSCLGKLAAQQQ